MESIAIFEDGKNSRGIKAKLIKREDSRILIEFDDEDGNEQVWFESFGKSGMYFHSESNFFYCDYQQSEEFKDHMRECYNYTYFVSLYGEG